MDTIYYRSLLFDFYSELLTDKQRDILRMHLQEDLSLGEISEIRGISRQGASDAIHRGMELLEQMENKLHLTRKYIHISGLIDQLEEKLEEGAEKQELVEIAESMRSAVAISMDQE